MNENTVREEQKRVDSEIRIYEDYAKQYNREHLKLDTEERRDLKQEEMRERRKAQVEKMVVNAEGLPIVFTQNVRVGRKDRICANIMYPKIVEIRRLGGEMDIYYLLDGVIGQRKKNVVLDPKQCGNGSYIIRALGSVGGQIYSPKVSYQKQYAYMLITYLIAECDEIIEIPDRRGWYMDGKNNLQFWSGKPWKEIERCVVR